MWNNQMHFSNDFTVGDFARLLYGAVHNLFDVTDVVFTGAPRHMQWVMPDHNIRWTSCPTLSGKCVGSLTSHSYFFKVVRRDRPAYSPYLRRLESLTLYFVLLRQLEFVRYE